MLEGKGRKIWNFLALNWDFGQIGADSRNCVGSANLLFLNTLVKFHYF